MSFSLKILIYLIGSILVYLSQKSLWIFFSFLVKDFFSLKKQAQGLIEFINHYLSYPIQKRNSPSSTIFLKEKEGMKIPDYSFYTDLVLSLLQAKKEYGGAIEEVLKKIKQEVLLDSTFQEQVRKNKLGQMIQFFLVGGIVWLLVFQSEQILEFSFSLKEKISLLFLHGSGLILFLLLYQVVYKKEIAIFDHCMKGPYLLKIFLSSGRPLSHAIEDSRVNDFFQTKKKIFSSPQQRLQQAIFGLKNFGLPISFELEEIVKELWLLREQGFKDFLKKIVVIKYTVLVLFFLMSYFYTLFLILKKTTHFYL